MGQRLPWQRTLLCCCPEVLHRRRQRQRLRQLVPRVASARTSSEAAAATGSGAAPKLPRSGLWRQKLPTEEPELHSEKRFVFARSPSVLPL